VVKVSSKRPADAVEPHEVVIPWSESYKLARPGSSVTFSGDSYEAWLESFPWVTGLPRAAEQSTAWIQENAIAVGSYHVYLRQFPMWELSSTFPLSALRWRRARLAMFDARQSPSYCLFDRPVYIPIMLSLETSRLYGSSQIWMSLTPNEIVTQRPQIRRAKGRVGVAGLGMGWAVQRMLERSQVRHLTVVEKDAAVLDYFGEPLRRMFGDRLTLVCDDAYLYNWTGCDTVLWDIWPNMVDGYYDRKFQELRTNLRSRGVTCEGWAAWTPRQR